MDEKRSLCKHFLKTFLFFVIKTLRVRVLFDLMEPHF